MRTTTPRVLVISQRQLEPHVSWASSYEFEDVVCVVDAADLVAVEPVHRTAPHWVNRVLSKLERQGGVRVSRIGGQKKINITNAYDLLFVPLAGPQDVEILDAVEGWQDRCRIKVCWIQELWSSMLRYPKLLAPLQQFDHIFVGHAPTPEQLSRLVRKPCSFLSYGVDALRFCPHPNPPLRSIDFYALGRRSPSTHSSLLERCARNQDFHYVYDSARWTTLVDGHAQHRELTANLIKRSRYFMADRAKTDMPEQTNGEHVFGPRFFEGAAAGAVLVGDAPDCDTFRDYFDWPDAVIPFAYGSPGIGDLIDELDADPTRLSRARQANVGNTLERHDWMYRWQKVLDTVGMKSLPATEERRMALQRRAQDVFSAQPRPRLISVAR